MFVGAKDLDGNDNVQNDINSSNPSSHFSVCPDVCVCVCVCVYGGRTHTHTHTILRFKNISTL